MTSILVVGAGATGGYFGGRLAQAGRDVRFLVRPARAQRLRRRGLRIVGLDGAVSVIEPELVTAADLDRPYDIVLLGVKATGLVAAVDDLAPAVGPDSVVVPFLNGLAHLGRLTERFPGAVLGGVVKLVTTVDDDGDIVQLGPLSTVDTGELGGGASTRVDHTVSTLDGAGFTAGASSDIVAAMWHKWMFIAAAGALTGLARGTVGDIVAQPGGARLAGRILAEAFAVSEAAGHPVPDGDRAFATTMLTQPGSRFTSSLYRDVVAGRVTEGEHILGDLCGRAARLGLDTPLLDLASLQLRVHEARLASA